MNNDNHHKRVAFSDTKCFKCGTHFNFYDGVCPKCGCPAGWNEKDDEDLRKLIERVDNYND